MRRKGGPKALPSAVSGSMRNAVVFGPKRGHNHDFSLTKWEMRELIRLTSSPKTKAILILEGRGLKVREIVDFDEEVLYRDVRLQGLSVEYRQLLEQFGGGFDISRVAVWRRTKKALEKAAELGVLKFDPEKTPFPEALRVVRSDPALRDKIEQMAKRVHVLNGGAFDLRDPLTDCPHIDCYAMREIISMYDRERKEER